MHMKKEEEKDLFVGLFFVETVDEEIDITAFVLRIVVVHPSQLIILSISN